MVAVLRLPSCQGYVGGLTLGHKPPLPGRRHGTGRWGAPLPARSPGRVSAQNAAFLPERVSGDGGRHQPCRRRCGTGGPEPGEPGEAQARSAQVSSGVPRNCGCRGRCQRWQGGSLLVKQV